MTFRLTCIIPAFNEAPRIGHVLQCALATPAVAEVIVIDDGSTDGTAEVAETIAAHHPGLHVLRQPHNSGKTLAVARGAPAARGSHILLLDSDLAGLTPRHLSALIEPVQKGMADVSISLRGNAPAPWRWIGLDYISGERVLPRTMIADHTEALYSLPHFGLEVYLNREWLGTGAAIAVVRWPDVSSPTKRAKLGAVAGLSADVQMIRDIFRMIPAHTVIGQIWRMRAARVQTTAPQAQHTDRPAGI